jgi:peptidoglycan LD-endopeptidase CwlK
MEHHKFSKSSVSKLNTCHHDLQMVISLALKYSKHDFGVSEGLRTLNTQKKYLEEGKTTTLESRHLPNEQGVSEAVDLYAFVDGKASWDERHLRKVAQAVFRAAQELGVNIEWGGHWESFLDMPHFELARW